jgi:hypothetical protein
VSGRRRGAEERWSASSSLTAFDAAGQRVDEASAAAVTFKVRWRYDGVLRKRTLSGPGAQAAASQLQVELLAARSLDWPADEQGRPVVPGAVQASSEGAEAGDHLADVVPLRPVAERSTLPRVAAPSSSLPVAAKASGIGNIDELADWYLELAASTKKRRGGEGRSPTTIGGYRSDISFLREHARYAAGDPRLEALGLEPGASMRVDSIEHGINSQDLINLVALRESTNLRTRGANERALQRFAKELADEERRAAKASRPVVMPEMPTPREEVVEARTIEAFCRTTKAALVQAHQRGKAVRDEETLDEAARDEQVIVTSEWRRHDLAVLSVDSHDATATRPLAVVEAKVVGVFDHVTEVSQRHQGLFSSDAEKLRETASSVVGGVETYLLVFAYQVLDRVPDELMGIVKYSHQINRKLDKLESGELGRDRAKSVLRRALDVEDLGLVVADWSFEIGEVWGLRVTLDAFLVRVDPHAAGASPLGTPSAFT